MYLGADYHPELWVYPFGGSPEDPEARWREDAQLMAQAGINVVRMGEFCWALYEPEEGKYDFSWMRRAMDIMKEYNIKVVLATPTAAPPIWLLRKHPEILPLDENGLTLREGVRRTYSMNSDVYWQYVQKIVTALAKELGDHPQLLAWQVDNGIGEHDTEFSFNEDTKRDWIAWLKKKYKDITLLNQLLGLRFWGQIVTRFEDVPMPMRAPTYHNPAIMLEWMRFCSDTCVTYLQMQVKLLKKLTPHIPVTTNLKALRRNYDLFDMAEQLDFVSLISYATLVNQPAENAVEHDIMRSLKKNGKTPDGNLGYWVIEQKAGNVSWLDVNSRLRPGVVRLFTYQSISRGANGIFYFYWRSPRFGNEKFYGGILGHDGSSDSRTYREVCQIGEELKLLAPFIEGTKVESEACILYTHDNEWALRYPLQPTKYFSLREHIMRFYKALHDRNIPVDFSRPTEDISRYKIVFAPSLHLLSAEEADLLKAYVNNGGTLVATCNTGLVDEYCIVPEGPLPYGLTDVFGMEVEEFDPIPPNEEHHLHFKQGFPTRHAHCAKIWCDVIRVGECEVLATFTKDYYAGRAAMTINEYGLGRAIYIGFLSDQPFYFDLIDWLRELCGLSPLLKVPERVEVGMRQKEGLRLFFLLNHNSSSVRINFVRPVHELLTGTTISGNYELPGLGVMVIAEKVEHKITYPKSAESTLG